MRGAETMIAWLIFDVWSVHGSEAEYSGERRLCRTRGRSIHIRGIWWSTSRRMCGYVPAAVGNTVTYGCGDDAHGRRSC